MRPRIRLRLRAGVSVLALPLWGGRGRGKEEGIRSICTDQSLDFCRRIKLSPPHHLTTSLPNFYTFDFEYSSEDLQLPPSNYRSHLKRAHSFHPVMNNHIQDPPAQERNSLGKDTGFPEPLSEDRNTTLPHPEADTSPNATIEAPDINMTRTHSRRSFLSRHSSHQKNSSFHPKDLEKSGLYDNIQYADGSREEKSMKELQGEDSGKGSSDGSSLNGSFDKDGRRYSDGERKRGLFAKLGFS